MNSPATHPLTPSQQDLVQGPVSICAASCNAALRPSVTRALGCRIAPESGELRLLIDSDLATDFLVDVQQGRRLAAVFADVISFRSLQLKARSPRTEALAEADHDHLREYLAGFGRKIREAGDSETVSVLLVDHRPERMVAVVFHPEEAFEQTPGPKAGRPAGAES